jgi:REP element-mobilizing transposase RayT
MSETHKSRPAQKREFLGKHAFEHWYKDNQIYFITARCRDRFPAFRTEEAKAIFWDRFDHYTKEFGYVPWITTLIDNHYHTLGYLKYGKDLGPMMQRIHGSVAKLVNDTLPERLTPFWRDCKDQSYFDGCIRDEIQCRRAYFYVLRQCIRHGICSDPRKYAHTHVNVEFERGLKRALELRAFLSGVPYKRYDR